MGKYLSGQGASEYLIILAVVLIVAMVAIALLGAFPAFGGDARMSETTQYWSSQHPFSILQWNQVNSSFQVSILNTDTGRLILTNITVGNSTYSPAGGITFNSGAQKTVTIPGLPTCTVGQYDYFEYNVTIGYNTSYISNNQPGAKPLIGPCNP